MVHWTTHCLAGIDTELCFEGHTCASLLGKEAWVEVFLFVDGGWRGVCGAAVVRSFFAVNQHGRLFIALHGIVLVDEYLQGGRVLVFRSSSNLRLALLCI